MFASRLVRCGCAWSLLVVVGCNHFIESKVIEQFTVAMKDGDLTELRLKTSANFKHKALRRAESLDDLKVVGLPDQPPAIMRVEAVSENEKHVVVEVGRLKRKLLYKLIREPGNDEWVVDDVYMKRKTSQRVEVTRTVSDQMDLLLTVRDFLDAWELGDRNQVLNAATPDLREKLAALPPTVLAQLTKRAMGTDVRRSRVKPDAQMEGKVALVKLPRTSGDVLIRFRLTEAGWKADDVATESRDDDAHISSIRKTANVLLTASRFLNAVNSNDRTALPALTTQKFNASTLTHTNLPGLKLIALEFAPSFDVSVHNTHSTVIVPSADDLAHIRLVPVSEDKPSEFVVEDVQFFSKDGKVQKSLAASVTAEAKAMLFFDALAKRDLPLLRRLATPDFNSRVWDRVDAAMADVLLEDVAPNSTGSIVKTGFEGEMTRVTLETTQIFQNAELVFREWDGELKVDEVHLLSNYPDALPKSDAIRGSVDERRFLKRRYEALIPVLEFAVGVHRDDVRRIQRVSSYDFNRLVWKQSKTVPDIGFPILKHLMVKPTSIELEQDKGTVILGDERFGAKLNLVKDGDFWVVDDAQLIAGVQPEQRTHMKNTMRIQLALRFNKTDRSLKTDQADLTMHADEPVLNQLPLPPNRNAPVPNGGFQSSAESGFQQRTPIYDREAQQRESQYRAADLRPVAPF